MCAVYAVARALSIDGVEVMETILDYVMTGSVGSFRPKRIVINRPILAHLHMVRIPDRAHSNQRQTYCPMPASSAPCS